GRGPHQARSRPADPERPHPRPEQPRAEEADHTIPDPPHAVAPGAAHGGNCSPYPEFSDPLGRRGDLFAALCVLGTSGSSTYAQYACGPNAPASLMATKI